MFHKIILWVGGQTPSAYLYRASALYIPPVRASIIKMKEGQELMKNLITQIALAVANNELLRSDGKEAA